MSLFSRASRSCRKKQVLVAIANVARRVSTSNWDAARLIRDALSVDGQAAAVVVARTVVMNARTAPQSSSTIAAPPIAGTQPGELWHEASSFIVFTPAHEASPPVSTGSDGTQTPPESACRDQKSLSIVQSRDVGESDINAVAGVLRDSRSTTGLDATHDVDCASVIRAGLTAQLGGAWSVALCPEKADTPPHLRPAAAFPLGCPFLEATLTCTSGDGLYRVFLCHLPPGCQLEAPPTPLGLIWRNPFAVARVALYAVAAASLVAYFSFDKLHDNACARHGFVTPAWGPLAGFASSSATLSKNATAYTNPAPLPGCSENDARAAEKRLSLSPALMYAGLGALALASLVRMAQNAWRREKLRRLLSDIAAGTMLTSNFKGASHHRRGEVVGTSGGSSYNGPRVHVRSSAMTTKSGKKKQ